MVEEAGRRCVLLPGDLATEAGCQAAVKGAVDALGRIDILVSGPPVLMMDTLSCVTCVVMVRVRRAVLLSSTCRGLQRRPELMQTAASNAAACQS